MYDRENDIERLFIEDSRDKKRTASGARHNSGRRGGGTRGIMGRLHMPADLLKYSNRKAYKEYTKASEVKVSNIYTDLSNIPSLDKIELSNTPGEIKTILSGLKQHHTNKALLEHWNISCGKLYSRYEKYGVEFEKRAKRVMKAPILAPQIPIQPQYVEQKPIIEEEKIMIQEKIKIEDTFEIKFIKTNIDGMTIQDQITNFVSILNKDSKYEVKLIIKELEEE